MISVTKIITASLSAEKKDVRGLALGPILPSIIPKTIENTAKPRIFIPPVGLVPTPTGIVSELGYSSRDIVVMLTVALTNMVLMISSLSPIFTGELPVTLYTLYFPGSDLYCVLFCREDKKRRKLVRLSQHLQRMNLCHNKSGDTFITLSVHWRTLS